MRVVDLCVSREVVDDLGARVEELGHRMIVMLDGDPAIVRIVTQRGDTDEFLTEIRKRLRDAEVSDRHYVVFEPLAVEPRCEEEEDGGVLGERSVAGTDEIETFVEEGKVVLHGRLDCCKHLRVRACPLDCDRGLFTRTSILLGS